jgi:hypothetical protein
MVADYSPLLLHVSTNGMHRQYNVSQSGLYLIACALWVATSGKTKAKKMARDFIRLKQYHGIQ